MIIEADKSSLLSQDRSVRIAHGDLSVLFKISLYKQEHFRRDVETFASINDYWASLPPKAQEEIYNIYADIRELFDSVRGMVELRDELMDLVAKLMSYHNPVDVIRWIQFHSGLSVPRSVEPEYKRDVDKNTTRDQTYIYEDYLGLMALSVIFRAMIPIWTVYNKTVSNDGNKVSKETHSFQLLRKSVIFDSKPLERLTRYIAANLNKSSHTGNHTLELICSDDMPEYHLALVCVRKLCLGELRVDDPRQNLAALVYNFITDRPGPQGNDYSRRVQEKRIPSEGAGETGENNGSTLELYKVRATVTVGRIAEMEFPWGRPHDLCIQLAPDYNPAHLDEALQTTQELYTRGIKPCNIQLAQWVVAPVFPPMGLYYMENHLLLRALAVTETVLRTRGFKHLALLSTAHAIDLDDADMRVSPVGTKSHMSQELVERIAKNFPYVREQRKRSSGQTRQCFVTEDIKDLAFQFAEHTWRATASEELVKEVLRTSVRRIPILSSLRSDLGSMLCDAEEVFH